MRKLRDALGVESMSLYRHIAGKTELIAAMLDAVADTFPAPSGEGEWLPPLRQNAIQISQILQAHPWASRPLAERSMIGPARLRHIEAVLARMRGAGLSIRMAHFALHAYDAHVMGFLGDQERRDDDSDAGPDVASVIAGEHADIYPHIAESMSAGVHDSEGEFEIILDILLEGFARRLGHD